MGRNNAPFYFKYRILLVLTPRQMASSRNTPELTEQCDHRRLLRKTGQRPPPPVRGRADWPVSTAPRASVTFLWLEAIRQPRLLPPRFYPVGSPRFPENYTLFRIILNLFSLLFWIIQKHFFSFNQYWLMDEHPVFGTSSRERECGEGSPSPKEGNWGSRSQGAYGLQATCMNSYIVCFFWFFFFYQKKK